MTIADNLEHLHQQIQKACRRADRSDSEVALMAVTKVHPVEVILGHPVVRPAKAERAQDLLGEHGPDVAAGDPPDDLAEDEAT